MEDLTKQDGAGQQDENAGVPSVSSATEGSSSEKKPKPKQATNAAPSGQPDLLDPNASKEVTLADGLVEVTVADGRSIWDGKTHHKPGAVLTISKDDADALRRKGFIHDPAAVPVPKGIGPSFTPEDGPRIKGY